MYEVILFDLDGTLTDSKEGILKSIRYALEKLHRPVPTDELLLKFIGPPLQDSFVRYCGMTPEEGIAAILTFQERYNVLGKFENAATPGLPELCAQLHAQGRTLALASSKPEEMCLDICEKYGYSPVLSAIVGSPPAGDWQKADVIRESFRRLHLTDEDRPRVLMVGDRRFDVEGAKAVGIDCVGVEFFGYAAPGELEEAGAVAVVKTVAELAEFLRTH